MLIHQSKVQDTNYRFIYSRDIIKKSTFGIWERICFPLSGGINHLLWSWENASEIVWNRVYELSGYILASSA